MAGGNNADERSEGPRLDRVRDYLSQYTESVANFYSPLQSPAGKFLFAFLNFLTVLHLLQNLMMKTKLEYLRD